MSKKTTTPASKKKQGNVMYIGPTIVGTVRHSTVFKDGVLPEKVKKCVAELPMMEKMFVSIEEVPTALKELKKNQSVLATVYNKTLNKFK